MKFQPERLIQIRKKLGINKAEAARLLNMSAMGYGRYEKGEREPSFQTVSFIAQTFNTTTDYLYGRSNHSQNDNIIISREEDPELYIMIERMKENSDFSKKILAYYQKLK